jgi:transposase
MRKKFITLEERAQLIAEHRVERDGRVRDRMKVVLWSDEGWTLERIAKALFINEKTASQHLSDYEESKKLKPENGGSSSLLTTEQTVELVAHLDGKLYGKIKEIRAYVLETYGVSYSIRGMTDWLKRQKFSFHQPCGVPAKADAAAQKAFIAEYETLKKTLPDGDHIVFADGVHPSHAVRFVRGWIRIGKRLEIPTNASQKRLNIMGALNLETMQLHRKEYKTLNAESVLDFLTFLLAVMATGTIHIILDRGRYQHCQAVWDFVALNPRIKLHYLPAYSPNLNAIEPAWKIMHEHTTHNVHHPTFNDFAVSIRSFFDEIFPNKASQWVDRLTDNFRPLAAPISHA